MFFALAEALENLADEVMALDAMGPIDYIEFKADDFLMKVDDFITDLTSEPKSEAADYTEDDESWDDPVCEGTEPADEKVMEKEEAAAADTATEQQEAESATAIHSEYAAAEEFESVPEAETTEMNSEEQDVEAESGDDGSTDGFSSDDGIEAGIAFCNAHMDKIKEIITDTAKKINASKYSEQQEYLQDVFELSADKCWNYLKKELAEEKEKPDADVESLNSIKEQNVKDMVICIATTMFLQLAVESLAKED